MASNRDEFYDRPAEQLTQWTDNENIIAGRDKQDGGTWMGVTKTGRFSALTNYRDLSRIKDNAPSRGFLVSDFLQKDESPEEYLTEIQKKASQYNDFNLLVGDIDDLFYFSNVNNKLVKVEPGVHGLSNRFLDTPWPKVEKGKRELKKHIQNDNIDTELIINLLSDTSLAPDNELPDTGVGLEWERALSPIFIKTSKYGTRASSLLTIDYRGNISFIEKSYIQISGDKFSIKTKRINS